MSFNDLDKIEIIQNFIKYPEPEEYNLVDADDSYLHLVGEV